MSNDTAILILSVGLPLIFAFLIWSERSVAYIATGAVLGAVLLHLGAPLLGVLVAIGFGLYGLYKMAVKYNATEDQEP